MMASSSTLNVFFRVTFSVFLLWQRSSADDGFVYPDDPELYNLTWSETNLTSGYNPWMTEYREGDPKKTSFVLMTGGCIPVEEGGSSHYQSARKGWEDACKNLGLECRCRPIVVPKLWNVEMGPGSGILGEMNICSWEIARLLEEHKRGRITLGGIAARCDHRHAYIFDEARELGVPLFLLARNPPDPGDEEFGLPQPDGFIHSNDEFLGRTMARSLKQLNPSGGVYGFIMQWESPSVRRQRAGFNAEMEERPSDRDRPTWKEVARYPYERPYNLSVECHYMTCAMDGLILNTTVDSIIFLYETPIRDPNFTAWVDSYRHRKLTLISKGSEEYIHLLDEGYVDGLVGDVPYDVGRRAAEELSRVTTEVALGAVTLPLPKEYYPTKLITHNIIPTSLKDMRAPDLDQNLLGNTVYMGYAFLGIVWLTALFCAVWTVASRSKQVVRTAQPFFLLVLIAGIVIFSGTIIPLSFDDDGNEEDTTEGFARGVCMSQPWLAFTGFTVIFSALFSKTWRVNRLFHAAQGFHRLKVTTKDVIAPFAAIFACNVIVLVCWTIIDPLTYTRLVGQGTDYWNREISTYGGCRSDNALAFLMPLAVINFACLGIACWQAFEARSIQSAFSESKFIAFSVASLFQAFLTGIPVLVIVKDQPKAFYLLLVMIIFVLSEGILFMIFVPKIYLAERFSRLTPVEQRRMLSVQILQSSNQLTSSNDDGDQPEAFPSSAGDTWTLGIIPEEPPKVVMQTYRAASSSAPRDSKVSELTMEDHHRDEQEEANATNAKQGSKELFPVSEQTEASTT